jgi:hypothetical protein
MSARGQRGLETVELAIILPVFLLLLFAILDFGRMFFTQITLQHAMREGGRFGVTGERLADPNDPRTLQSRLDSIKRVVRESAVGVRINPADIHVFTVPGSPDDAGGPGQTFTIRMSYDFLFVTPMVGRFFDNGTHRFSVSTTFRSEPYPIAGAGT